MISSIFNSLQRKSLALFFLSFLFPFLLWLFLLSDFIFGPIAVNIDTNSNYAIIKFFYNSLKEGVFPLWDPFVGLGRPYIFLTTSGVFNPLLSLIMLVWTKLSLNYYQAYIFYIVFYFALGLLGFYSLSRQLLKEHLWAFFSYVFLLFSGVGITIFNQVNMLLIFVPAVWFFFFLLRFYERGESVYFIGMLYCLMLLLTSYLPFYFMTLFLVIVLLILFLYPVCLKKFLFGLLKFFRKHPFFLALSIFSIFVSMIPLLHYKYMDPQHENVVPSRHCLSVPITTCYERTLAGGAEMSYQETARGNLSGRVNFRLLFSDLDQVQYAHDSLFYVPFFCYILIIVSVFFKTDKKMLFLFLLGVLLTFIAVGDKSFIHQICYSFIFYFRYFRNLFVLMVYLMPILILVSVFQLKAILQHKVQAKNEKKKIQLGVLGIHLLFGIFLWYQKGILLSSYFTLLGSALFFFYYFQGAFIKKSNLKYFFIISLTLVQPIQFFNIYRRNAADFKCQVPSGHVQPKFHFKRPQFDIKSSCKIFEHVPEYIDTWQTMLMQDSSGTVWFSGNSNRWVFQLAIHLKSELLKNKFILYDAIESIDKYDWTQIQHLLEETLNKNKNVALVTHADHQLLESLKDTPKKKDLFSKIVLKPSKSFQIKNFTVNSLNIYTYFLNPKFLVYNDSFHTHWRVFINDHEEKIYRANWAFKGIYLPSGENNIRFEYSPPGGAWIFYFIMGYYFIFFVCFLGIVFRSKEKVFSFLKYEK